MPNKHDEWQTPPDLAERLDREFLFTQEICASLENRVFPDLRYMGLDNGRDALTNDWGIFVNERCYVNPPYSKLTAFVERACEMSIGRLVVMLIPAYTDTKYFHNIIRPHAREVRLIKGRIKFWENGKPGRYHCTFPSALVIFDGRDLSNIEPCKVSFWDYKA